MLFNRRFLSQADIIILAIIVLSNIYAGPNSTGHDNEITRNTGEIVTIHHAVMQDISPPLALLALAQNKSEAVKGDAGPGKNKTEVSQKMTTIPQTAASIEQTKHGTKSPPEIVTSFDGLGENLHSLQDVYPVRPHIHARAKLGVSLNFK